MESLLELLGGGVTRDGDGKEGGGKGGKKGKKAGEDPGATGSGGGGATTREMTAVYSWGQPEMQARGERVSLVVASAVFLLRCDAPTPRASSSSRPVVVARAPSSCACVCV